MPVLAAGSLLNKLILILYCGIQQWNMIELLTWKVVSEKSTTSGTMEFSLNGAELSLNSVNSGNLENLRNH